MGDAVRPGEGGPGEIGRLHAPLGPSFAVPAVAAGAGQRSGWHLDASLPHHRDDRRARGARPFLVDPPAALQLLPAGRSRGRRQNRQQDEEDEAGAAGHPSPLSFTTLSTTGKSSSAGARAKAFFQRPVRSLPMRSRVWWFAARPPTGRACAGRPRRSPWSR